MIKTIHTIAFDGDDTLWHNESLYALTQEKFAQLLAPYHDAAWVDRKLYETEMRNMRLYGYGLKAFTLSMIETAIELTEGRIQGYEIQQIIDATKAIRQAKVALLDGVATAVAQLAETHRLMLITKGDLLDQEAKIAGYGLADFFADVEIVSDKTAVTYQTIMDKYQIPAEQFLMVGNSLKSDVLPVVELGGIGVHIPYHITWEHETVGEQQQETAVYHALTHISQLPELVARLAG
ncbi:MAG: HAD family hydrolase [Anaerolineales bacterium]|nr:HAD family hydrolase [Anaerolineales bacterium]